MVRKTKLNNKKVVIDDITFASKLEADCYIVLKELQEQNVISNLELQSSYILIPSFKCGNEKYRGVKYYADFTFNINDDFYVIDSKGMMTDKFKIKKKLMAYVNHINILLFYKKDELRDWCIYVKKNGYINPPVAPEKRKKKK